MSSIPSPPEAPQPAEQAPVGAPLMPPPPPGVAVTPPPSGAAVAPPRPVAAKGRSRLVLVIVAIGAALAIVLGVIKLVSVFLDVGEDISKTEEFLNDDDAKKGSEDVQKWLDKQEKKADESQGYSFEDGAALTSSSTAEWVETLGGEWTLEDDGGEGERIYVSDEKECRLAFWQEAFPSDGEPQFENDREATEALLRSIGAEDTFKGSQAEPLTDAGRSVGSAEGDGSVVETRAALLENTEGVTFAFVARAFANPGIAVDLGLTCSDDERTASVMQDVLDDVTIRVLP